MSEWKAKRFWKQALAVPAKGGFGVELDGRAVKTPAKRALILPSEALAQAIAAEWDAQEEAINPTLMPFTRTANAAIDKVSIQKGEVADMLAAYGDSDLLCYRADGPEALIARQSQYWDPVLDWAADTLGARLHPRTGIMHKPQDPEALSRLSERTHALSDFELAAFHDLVSLSGSLILGFAAAMQAWDIHELWDFSRLDEEWQAEQWGRDEEADALMETKKRAFLHARQVLDLICTH